MASHCGQPNTANYGDCIVCGPSYEQIKETAVLDYLENSTNLHETYGKRLKRRQAYLAGMDQGTVLFKFFLIPVGKSDFPVISSMKGTLWVSRIHPGHIQKTLHFLSLRYSADFRRSRLVYLNNLHFNHSSILTFKSKLDKNFVINSLKLLLHNFLSLPKTRLFLCLLFAISNPSHVDPSQVAKT